MVITRRQILARTGALGATALLPARSRAAPAFSFRYATDAPSTHSSIVALKSALAEIERESDGRIHISLLPDGQLGTSPEMLSQVRSGAMDFSHMSTGQLSTLIPVMTLPNLAFLFSDYDQLYRGMDGALGSYLLSQFGKLNAFHLHPKVWDVGFRHITTTSRPISEPDDLRGLKMRVPPNRMATTLFSALGAAPTPLPWPELYPALAAKLVDGQENPLSLILGGKLYEVQKYCALSRHQWEGWYTIISNRAWRSLPADLQEIVARNLDKAVIAQRAASAKEDQNLQDVLKQRITVTTPNIPEFRSALAKTSFYREWKANFGEEAWALIEKNIGPIA